MIYIGTFSKILFPSLRLGYLVVPPAWVSLVSRAKWLCDRQSPLLEQYALTDLIAEGHLERHIRRMRTLYNHRRQALVQALERYLSSQVTIVGESAGIHLIVRIDTALPDEIVIQRAAITGIHLIVRIDTALPDEIVIQRAAIIGVGLISAQEYYLTTPKSGEFIFGYAQLDATQIEQGIQKFAQVLKD